MNSGGNSDEAFLSLRGLTKRFGGVTAVDNIDLDIAKGEFLALLGPSGCGKSTTLMAIAGFERPDAGAILLEGRDITDEPPERRNMGVVFQDYALFPHMTVMQNVMFPLRKRGALVREAEERARRALDLVQLPAATHHARPQQLSGGQRQRVALARATVFDPLVLLMDEPLSALDRRLRQSMQFELRHLQHEIGATVIYVTHDQEEALVLADRIAVMRDGRFEQIGDPQTLYDKPQMAFVAGFLGESNMLSVTVVSQQAGTAEVTVQGNEALRFEVPSDFGVGRQAMLLVRPENVLVTQRDGEAAEGPALPGEVVDVAFLGHQLRVELNVAGGGTWTALLHPRRHCAETAGLKPDTPVVLTWEANDARLVDL